MNVLARHKSLLVFPAMTAAFTLLTIALFLFPTAMMPTGHSLVQAEHWAKVFGTFFSHTQSAAGSKAEFHLGTAGWFVWAALYFVGMFIATFFNVAFYHEILAALRGGEVSLSRGLGFAVSRWKSILLWTLFAGLIGIVIKALEEKFDFFGRWVMKIVGAAWNVACIFVIPALVDETESENPVAILKKSAATLRRTWGEAVLGYAGLAFGNLLVALMTVFVLVGAVVGCAVYGHYALFIAVAGAWLALVFAYSYIMGVASQIYRGALYLYASDGQLAEGYTPELMASGWKMKKV